MTQPPSEQPPVEPSPDEQPTELLTEQPAEVPTGRPDEQRAAPTTARSLHDADTQLMTTSDGAQPLATTLEMPVISAVEAPPATPAPPSTPEPSPAEPPPATPPSTTPVAPSRPSPLGALTTRPGFVPIVLTLAVVIVIIAAFALAHRGSAGGGAAAGGGRPTVVHPTVTSFDPSGGSGFSHRGEKAWRTQGYASATFGNLKKGVGLLLDLGAARRVSAVTIMLRSGPLDLDLRSADRSGGSAADFRVVTRARGATGSTILRSPDGSAHRYWLVWVTRLAPRGGGFGALVDTPVVQVSP